MSLSRTMPVRELPVAIAAHELHAYVDHPRFPMSQPAIPNRSNF
jgi:hypothetical protein